MKKKILTLTVIHDAEKILLGMKKRGYAAGRWNGYGGKLEPGESIEAGMLRELNEESGLVSKKHEQVGLMTFISDIEDYISEVHIFKIHDYEGVPEETEEMRPQWFSHDEIPYKDMWPDDIHWLPLILEGKKILGKFYFENNDTIRSQELVEVECF